jgi:hypothetical protein
VIKKIISLNLVAALLVFCVVGCGKPAVTKEFSADNITKAGGMTHSSKFYFGKDKWRMDSEALGVKSITIARLDKNVVWILMPQTKMYMEQELKDEELVGKVNKLPGEVERKKVGTEKIDGVLCDKYKIVYKPEGAAGKAVVYQWISKDNIPVKAAAPDGSWSSVYKNIKIGKQPASLFELPAGYNKFKMPKIPM